MKLSIVSLILRLAILGGVILISKNKGKAFL